MNCKHMWRNRDSFVLLECNFCDATATWNVNTNMWDVSSDERNGGY